MQQAYDIPAFDGTPVEHLLAAVRARNFALADQLLPKVGVDCQDERGATPLQAAASSGSREMVFHLLDRGASLDVANKYGTPLTWFAAQGWTDLIDRCLSAGHNPFAGGEKHDSAFVIAAKQGHRPAMELMVSKAKWDDATKEQQLTAAFTNCQSKPVVGLIVDLGLDPHAELEGGETPLFALARHGATEACMEMIQRGADVNHRAEGYAAIYYASLYNKHETMLALLEAGAEENAITPNRENLVHAVSRANSDVQRAYAAYAARRATAAVLSGASLRANGNPL